MPDGRDLEAEWARRTRAHDPPRGPGAGSHPALPGMRPAVVLPADRRAHARLRPPGNGYDALPESGRPSRGPPGRGRPGGDANAGRGPSRPGAGPAGDSRPGPTDGPTPSPAAVGPGRGGDAPWRGRVGPASFLAGADPEDGRPAETGWDREGRLPEVVDGFGGPGREEGGPTPPGPPPRRGPAERRPGGRPSRAGERTARSIDFGAGPDAPRPGESSGNHQDPAGEAFDRPGRHSRAGEQTARSVDPGAGPNAPRVTHPAGGDDRATAPDWADRAAAAAPAADRPASQPPTATAAAGATTPGRDSPPDNFKLAGTLTLHADGTGTLSGTASGTVPRP